jgi:hypothetical protein
MIEINAPDAWDSKKWEFTGLNVLLQCLEDREIDEETRKKETEAIINNEVFGMTTASLLK